MSVNEPPRSLGAGLVILRERDGKVLLVRRSPQSSRPGRWSPPGGGVEEGEEPLRAALREAEEELGPLPSLEVLQDEGHWHANPFFAFGTFLAVLKDGFDWKPELNWENDAWGWFDPGELPSPLLPGVVPAIRDLVERSWRWKPPHMGIEAPERTYSAVKVVNVDTQSPRFLTTAATLIDDATGRGVVLAIQFLDRIPKLPVAYACLRTNLLRERLRYEALAIQDKALSIGWAEKMNWKGVIRFAMAHAITQGKRVLDLEDYLVAAASRCVD